MVRKISLVRSREQAFKIGLLAENLGGEFDEFGTNLAKYDAFILSEPGVTPIKVDKDVQDYIVILFHRYSNLIGKLNSIN